MLRTAELPGFLSALRLNGFLIGLPEQQRVLELLMSLEFAGTMPDNSEQLSNMLGAVLCCSTEQPDVSDGRSGKETLEERHIQFVSLVGVRRQRLSKLHRSGLADVQSSACPSGAQRSPSCKLRHRILLAEFDENFCVAPGSSSITANHLELGLVEIDGDQGRYMTDFDRVRDGFFDERPRRSDLTELPLGDSEDGSRGGAGIREEAEPGLTIPLGIVAQHLN